MTTGWHGPAWYSLQYGGLVHQIYFHEQIEYETSIALGDRVVLIGKGEF